MAAMATATALAVEAELMRTEEGELVAVTSKDPEQMLAEAQLVALARAFLPKLPHDEAELVRRHYLEGEQFNAVAKDFARSKSWASRLQSRALTRLAKHIQRAS
jgi:DNA-directed RNA polymerase specialized sigma subunit